MEPAIEDPVEPIHEDVEPLSIVEPAAITIVGHIEPAPEGRE